MTNPTNCTRDDMLADLDASDAEVDAELFIPSEMVRQDLLDSLARLKAQAKPAT